MGITAFLTSGKQAYICPGLNNIILFSYCAV